MRIIFVGLTCLLACSSAAMAQDAAPGSDFQAFASDQVAVAAPASPTVPTAQPKAADTSVAACAECGGCGQHCAGCGCGCGCISGADPCPCRGLELFTGLESFRQYPDGTYQNNNGLIMGANLGVPLLKDRGIGAQLGFSYGVYDWDGRNTINTSDAQQQIFVTAGIFRRITDESRISFGIAYDWMINDSYGVYASSPFLGQWRGQVGYALSDCNEVGFWGTIRDRSDVSPIFGVATVTYRPIDQGNIFWHHTFQSTGADSWVWVGLVEHEKLNGNGSLGDATVGVSLLVPLSDRVSVYANGQYMRPTADAGPAAAAEDAYSVGFGVVFYPGACARNRTVAGKQWMPLLPVANNGSFLVDGSSTM